MPRHDFKCSACGTILRDQYRTLEQGGAAHPPRCPHCFEMMTWVIPVPRMDLRSDGEGKSGETFQKFTCRDGQNNLVEIDSLHKLREVERESAKMAADGIGQPIVFRGFAQDHSNMSVNTFGEHPLDAPDMTLTAAGKRKFGLQNGAKMIDASEGEPEHAYGPGVSDANTSPLEDL